MTHNNLYFLNIISEMFSNITCSRSVFYRSKHCVYQSNSYLKTFTFSWKKITAFKSYCNMSAAAATKTKPVDEVVVIPNLEEPLISPNLSRQETEFNKRDFLKSWKWLSEYGPGFSVASHKVKIIHSPEDFYSTLLEKTCGAEKRVSLASLYLGSGLPEQKLVQALERNGIENPDLEIKVLLDFTRGSRGTENSRTMLIPLINNCHQCNVYLYHTPALRGIIKRWLPPRWNEIIGLQHMKIYIFDDSIIISGANLSTDYFTNRQDRYFLIEDCKALADFYDDLINQVSDFSLQLDGENSTDLKSNWKTHPSEGNFYTFVSEAKNHILTYYEKCKKDNSSRLKSFYSQSQTTDSESLSNSKSFESNDCEKSNDDTWIFPLVQMGGLGITYDKDATCKIFEGSSEGSHIKLATGYFNLTSEYVNKIIENHSVSYDILMAHPKANGFFGAKGFAGGIPAAYTQIAKQFLDTASAAKQLYRLSMKEYIRRDWTYHAKGLWYYPPNSTLPAATLIGSPNFGHRSVYRDLETQLYLITLNRNLQEELAKEQQHLFNYSKPFITSELSQPSRVVPLWVRMVIVFFRNFF